MISHPPWAAVLALQSCIPQHLMLRDGTVPFGADPVHLLGRTADNVPSIVHRHAGLQSSIPRYLMLRDMIEPLGADPVHLLGWAPDNVPSAVCTAFNATGCDNA